MSQPSLDPLERAVQEVRKHSVLKSPMLATTTIVAYTEDNRVYFGADCAWNLPNYTAEWGRNR